MMEENNINIALGFKYENDDTTGHRAFILYDSNKNTLRVLTGQRQVSDRNFYSRVA